MNRTMHRISEYLGWGTTAYRLSVINVYLMLAVFSFRSVRHRLSRARTLRHAALILLLNCLSVFMSVSMKLFTYTDVLVMLIPLLSIAGIVLVHAPEPGDKALGRRLMPVIRISLITLALFAIRQVVITLTVPTNEAAVLMKTLTGLPIAALTVYLYSKMPTSRRRFTMIAVLCYLVANAVINLSPALGGVIFMAGHAVLVCSNIKECPPKRWQYLLWIALTVLFTAEAFVTRNVLPGSMLYIAVPYVAVASALAVSSLRMSKRIRFGCLMTIIANQLLVVTWLAPGVFVLDSSELLLYYISIIALAADVEVKTKEQPESELAQK